MEVKLAEYRARKLKEQQGTETLFQRAVGLFGRTGSSDAQGQTDESRVASPSPSTQQQSQDRDFSSDPPACDSEEEEDVQPPPQKYAWLLILLKAALWVTVWLIFVELQFGAVFFIASALVFVYVNTRTGRRKKNDSLSAYSVFNPNCERLQGTITAEQLEANLLLRKPLPQS